ncbi:MAG: Ig-like domain repeat protein [Terriglobales bacterium]
MRTYMRLLSRLVVLFFLAAFSTIAFAAIRTSAVPKVRVTSRVDNGKRTTLYGHVPVALRRATDQGRLDPSTRSSHMIMVLKSDDEQKRELRRIIDEQQDKRTANFHQWATPEEFGAHFGVHDADIAQVQAWLKSQGFTVDDVSKSKRVIHFSGTTGQLETAFQTEMHSYRLRNGETHVSNNSEITVPEALSKVIAGVGLHNFFRKGHVGPVSRMKLAPNYTGGTATHYVGPADFATIYNTAPLLAEGINGTGSSIAVVGRSDILLSDVQTYRQLFNLPVNDPIFIHAGQDNGIQPGDDGESDLDVEISGGIAPNAQVYFVIGTPTFLVDGITNSIEYIVENNTADIMSISYGDCEANEGTGGNEFNNQAFEQAAAQGISVFVASGDNGPADCDDSNDSYEVLGYAAGGEASTPYSIAVGGAEFDEGNTTNAPYWSATTNPLHLNSALSYIPEYPWNEAKGADKTSTASGSLSGIWSGSGGISAYYLQPSWQRGPGVPLADPTLVGGNWITSYTITNAGAGYTVAPSVTFSGGGCTAEPSAASTISGGAVTGIVINYGTEGGTLHSGQGFGCTSAPTVTFGAAPTGGTTATATVTIGPMQDPPPLIGGVPHRYTPDVSLNAASGWDATFFCSEGVCEISPSGTLSDAGLVGGTSVAAPSMAGIQALINQANGGRQGMPGYIYYALAAAQTTAACNSSTPPAAGSNCAFQDITVGDNLICGLSTCTSATPAAKIGFTAGVGYDMASGLGSVNAYNLANQWKNVVFNSSNSTLNVSQTSGIAQGSSITFSGTVAAGSGTGTPTGDVAFILSQGVFGNGVNVNTGAWNGPSPFATLDGNGNYTANLSNLPAGTYNITARYGGDENFASSLSAPVQVTVNPGNATVTITPQAITQTASPCLISNSNTFTYGDLVWIPVTVTSGSGQGVPTGTVTITVDGNTYATETVDPQGIGYLAAGNVPTTSCLYDYIFSQSPTLPGGTHTIGASYSGDSTFSAATASPVAIMINKLTATPTLAAGATLISSGFAEPLTVNFGTITALTGTTKTSSGPTGTVTFTDTTTSTVLGTAAVVPTISFSGNTYSYSAAAALTTTGITTTGAHSITASYSGDSNFGAANSSAVTVTVSATGTATTTTVTSSANPTTLNGRPTFTATVAGGAGPTTGTVTFYDSTYGVALGTGSVGSSHTATFRPASGSQFWGGTHNITATYGGTGTFLSSTSPVFVETVTQGTVTITLTAKTVGKAGQAYTFAAVLTPSSTNATYAPNQGLVNFFDGATNIGSAQAQTVTSGQGGYALWTATLTVSSLTAGSHSITAKYSDVNYSLATSSVQTVFVGGTPTVTWATPSAITYGTALSATQLNATANIPGTFAYSPGLGAVLNAGAQTLSVTFTPADYTDFGPQTATVQLQVNPIPTTVVWSTPAAIAYGTPLSTTQLDASATPVSAGTYVYTPTVGTVLGAGSQPLSVQFTPSNSNYAPSTGGTTLQVTPGALTVAAIGAYSIYGQPLPALSYTITGFVPGDSQSSATTGAPSEGTTALPTSAPGVYPIVITQGTLAAANYTFSTFVNSTLTMQQAVTTAAVAALNSSIYPNQSTTLTATVSFTGSGAAPTGSVNFLLGATVLGTGTLSPLDATDSTATFTLTGSQLASGANSITAVYAGDTNYGGSTAAATTVTLLSNVFNFGVRRLRQASPVSALTYSFSSATTLTAVNILTLGAPGLDYGDAGGSTCTANTTYSVGQSCVVTLGFFPSAPGLREGAVTMFAQGSNLPLMTWYLSGVGLSGAVTIDPGTQSTIGTLANNGQAYGSAIDAAGNVYVADHANNVVIELAAGTYAQSTIVSSGLSKPTAVALDGAGNLYISDTGNGRVVVVPNEQGVLNSGDMSTVNISGLGSPRGIATDGSGNLYVADGSNGNVLEITSLGVQSTVASGLTAPHGVAVDATGNVYVASDNQVSEYPVGGGAPIAMGSGYNNPRGVAVDAAGAVYVADTGNSQIVRVAPGGASQATLAIAGVSSPQGVAVDSSDNVYVTDPSLVFQVNRTQAAALSFSNTNVGSTSAPQTLTVTDAGNGPLTILNLAITANFTQLPSGGTDCGPTFGLSSAGQCLIAVAFAPTTSGTLTGTLTLSDNALNNPASTQTVQLSGGGSQVAQTITFTQPAPGSAVYNSSFTVAATGGASGNPVTFTSAGSCSNVGATYTMTSGTGTCTVVANQAGNAEYSAAPQVTETVNATQASQSVAFTTDAPGSAAYNSSFTVAATGGASGNAVTFTSSGSCSNVGATYTMTSGGGTCSVIANQAGNSNYTAATQVTETVNATQVSQSITFTQAAPASAVYNSSFSVAATGGASGNAVAFTSSGSCSNVGATYTMTIGTGTCSVIANQAGNSNYTAATQVTETVNAAQASQTITFTQNAPGVAPYNSSFTVAASASSNLAVSFSSSGVCSNVGATYTMTSSTGTCTVIANQSGNGNYLPAPTVKETTTAAKAAQTVTFTGAPATAPYQSTFGVAATSDSNLTATITASGACSISGTTVTMIRGTGTCTMTAKWPSSALYLATSTTQTTTAEKLVSTITWANPAEIAYGTALSATQLDATANYPGKFTYSPALGVTPKAGLDTLKVTFTPTQSNDYTTASDSVVIQVSQATPVINWATPAAIVYGTKLSATQLDATATGVAGPLAGSFVYTPLAGKVLTAGTQTLSVTFTPTDHTDYVSVSDTVSLEVDKVGTTTAITSNLPNPSTIGHAVSVHFTVTPATNYSAPTGSVTVQASTGESCTSALAGGSGSCSVTFTSTGPRTLTATYAGDSNNLGSVSTGVPQTVN